MGVGGRPANQCNQKYELERNSGRWYTLGIRHKRVGILRGGEFGTKSRTGN